MPITKMKFFTREIVQSHPNYIFVFGDNLARAGLGGQAKACRGEPNTIGIITKIYPGTNNNDYLCDDDFYIVKGIIDHAFNKLTYELSIGKTIVIPEDGLGTGLAELPKRAPKIFAYICKSLEDLELI